MAMARHLVLTRRNQQTFVISKAGGYFFTLCQPTPSATCMYESVGFSPSNFYLKTTSPIIYTTITKFRASKNIQQVRHVHENTYITYMPNYLHWNSRRNYAVHALMFVSSSVSFVVHIKLFKPEIPRPKVCISFPSSKQHPESRPATKIIASRKKKAFHWLVSAICFKPCLFTLDFAYSRDVTEKLAKEIDWCYGKQSNQTES